DGRAREHLGRDRRGAGLADRDPGGRGGAADMAAIDGLREETSEHRAGSGGRQRGCERTPSRLALADRPPEVTAALTGAQVPADLAPVQDAPITVGDNPANRLTVHRAPLVELLQGAARLEQCLLGRTGRDR